MDVLRDGVKPSAARQGACLAGGGTRPRTGPARAAGLRGGICHGGAGYGGAALALDFREGRRIQPRDGSHDANHRETSPRESQGWALDVPTLRCLLRSPSDPMSGCSYGDASTGSVTAGGPLVTDPGQRDVRLQSRRSYSSAFVSNNKVKTLGRNQARPRSGAECLASKAILRRRVIPPIKTRWLRIDTDIRIDACLQYRYGCRYWYWYGYRYGYRSPYHWRLRYRYREPYWYRKANPYRAGAPSATGRIRPPRSPR